MKEKETRSEMMFFLEQSSPSESNSKLFKPDDRIT